MTVSLCLIARNEAQTLERCLRSVSDLVDEVIVVDTGSTDDTPEVARRLGAKLYHFAWIDDFAAARNECLRHATSQWIFWLDGDEYLDEPNRLALRALFAGLVDENAAYLVKQRSPVHSADGETVLFEQCRLFRNHLQIRWQYRIHEQIQPSVERSGGVVRPARVCIEHTGYQEATFFRRKLERNLRLLELENHERPGDSFTLMNLGWARQNLGQSDAALEHYRQSLRLCEPRSSIARQTQTLMVRANIARSRRQEALALCLQARLHFPDDVELTFLQAVLHSELGHQPEAETLYRQLLDNRREDDAAVLAHPGMRGHMVHHNLARLYLASGRAAEAEAYFYQVLVERPQSVRSLFELGKLYLEQGQGVARDAMIQRLEAVGGLGVLAANLLRAHLHVSRQEPGAARTLLEAMIAQGPPSLEPRLLLSRLLVQEKADSTATERAIRSVLALDPHHAEARQLLATLQAREGYRRQSVSLCMIVRNESANLPTCLGSVADLVHEMIVVDTGSTDDTSKVARQLGARVYDFAWRDDFAAARNESIRHATGDWILWLDGDERLDEENRQKLQSLISRLSDRNVNYVMKQRSTLDSKGSDASVFEQVRLFPNHPQVRWCYRVHEQILPSLERLGSISQFTDVVIEHRGYEDRERYQRKQERNFQLLLQQDLDQPNDSLTHFNLALTCLTLGRRSEAMRHSRRSLELAPANASWVRKIYGFLAGGTSDRSEALAWCREGLSRFPGDAELLFQQAALLQAAGDLAAAEASLKQLLQSKEDHRWVTGVDPGVRGHKAQHNLALIYRQQHRLEEAEQLWREILSRRPDYLRAALALGELLITQHREQDFERLIAQIEALPEGQSASAQLRALNQDDRLRPR